MSEFTLLGVPVKFPFIPYDCQLEYMEKVIRALQERSNALLESPTGTGKTLCLLCATLAWREAFNTTKPSATFKAKAVPEGEAGAVGDGQCKGWAERMKEGMAELRAEGGLRQPTIIYSSRTHSQLAQVMRELRNTAYKPRTSVLGSRSQMCLHPQVSSLSGAAANMACRALTQTRSCKWHTELEPFMKKHPEANTEPLDIEDLVKIGQVQGPCPYFLSREMAGGAELVFMPYQYLIDAKTRIGLDNITWEDAILIFDEAHNLESVCAETASCDLTAVVLATSIEEVQRALEAALARQESSVGRQDEIVVMAGRGQEPPPKNKYYDVAANLRLLKEVLIRLEGEIAALPQGPQPPLGLEGFTAPGAFIFQLLAKVNITEGSFGALVLQLEEAVGLLADEALDQGRKSGSRSSSYKMTALADFIRTVFNTSQSAAPQLAPAHLGYRVHVHMEKNKSGMPHPTLSYWCFSSGISMRALQTLRVRSVLLTSGTLSPLDSFANELQLPFPITLENPHVIDRSQVWVGVVPVGPKGHTLNSSYQTRNTNDYKEDLGNAIVNCSRVVPDGLLVFFPAYGVMKSCIDHWKAASTGGPGGTIWERITRHKLPVVEPGESALFPQAAEDFKSKLADPTASGAVFFAVCRGKVSEGLDFSDRAGRAVVITGIPYAMYKDPKVVLKKDVLDSAKRISRQRGAQLSLLGGDEWYKQQASRAVNQAMGRVIRHRRDYGAIILCDERFRPEAARRQLSCWLRGLVQVYPNFGQASGSLTKFFKEQAAVAQRRGPDAVKVAHIPGSDAFAAVPSVRSALLNPGRGASKPSGRTLQHLMRSMAIPTACDSSGACPGAPPGRGPGLFGALAQSKANGSHAGAAPGAENVGLEDLLSSLDQTAPVAAPAQAAMGSRQRPASAAAGRGASVHRPPEQQVRSQAVGPSHLVTLHMRQQQKRGTHGLGRPPMQSAQPEVAAAAAGSAAAAEYGDAEPEGAGVALQAQPLGQSKEAKAAQRAETVQRFLQQLQAELPEPEHKQVMRLLRAYKADRDQIALFDGIAEVMHPQKRRHLLQGFATFVSAPQQAWFSQCIRQLTQVASGKAAASKEQQPSSRKQQSAAGAFARQEQAMSGTGRGTAALSRHPLPPGKRSEPEAQPVQLPARPAKRQRSGLLAGLQQSPAASPDSAPPLQSRVAARGGIAAQLLPGVLSGRTLSGSGNGARGAATGCRRTDSERHSNPGQTSSLSAAERQQKGHRTAAGPAAAGRHPVVAGARAACPVCHKPEFDNPWQATCGHAACYMCWMQYLPCHFKCPVCSRPTRKQQLSRFFFA